ncbi:hypothetical protein MKW92_037699, partial [Papaver armeniacum]
LVATTGLVRSNTIPAMRNVTVDGWNQIQPQISGFQRGVSGRLYGFNHQARSILEFLGAFRKRCLPANKGT